MCLFNLKCNTLITATWKYKLEQILSYTGWPYNNYSGSIWNKNQSYDSQLYDKSWSQNIDKC